MNIETLQLIAQVVLVGGGWVVCMLGLGARSFAELAIMSLCWLLAFAVVLVVAVLALFAFGEPA